MLLLWPGMFSPLFFLIKAYPSYKTGAGKLQHGDQIWQLPFLVNQVSLEHSCTHPFTYRPWCALTTTAD